MSQGLASPPPVSAGAVFIARRPRWGPPRDIAGRPSSTRGTRHSPDVAAPSVAVVLHWLPHATGPLAVATTNEPTDSARRRRTPHSNCQSCKHEYGTCVRKLLFVTYAVDCLASKSSKPCSRLVFARVIEGLRGRPIRCAVTDYPGTGKDGPHSQPPGRHPNNLHGSDRWHHAFLEFMRGYAIPHNRQVDRQAHSGPPGESTSRARRGRLTIPTWQTTLPPRG